MIAVITPDRGDRPDFLEHCRYQVQRQTVKYLNHFVIDYAPVDGVVDIVPRIRQGLKMAEAEGFKYAVIFENDDYYPDNYVEKIQRALMAGYGLSGLSETIYYSIQNRNWRTFFHKGRSSLFTTAINLAEIRKYDWPEDDLLYFDRHLWASVLSKKLMMLPFPPIGIKHGEGFCPGNYHNNIVNGKQSSGMRADDKMAWLRRRVRPQSFEFYKEYSDKLIK